MLSVAASRSWPGHSNPSPSAATATLTYLEINGWLLTAAGVTVLCDPVLDGPLDFGIPGVYEASKRVLPASGLIDTLPPLDALLITQGLDDHAHARTLRQLARLDPELPVIAPPSARPALERAALRNVRYITSRSRRVDLPYLGLDALPTIRLPASQDADEATIEPRRRGGAAAGGGGLLVRATSGALVGPPWQRRENGYVVRSVEGGGCPTLYLEPHVEFDADELARLGPVDAVITPVSGQTLPGFELVHGPAASVELVATLRPRWVLPMCNGAVDATGLSAPLIEAIGSSEEFERGLRARGVSAEVLEVEPGAPITLEL